MRSAGFLLVSVCVAYVIVGCGGSGSAPTSNTASQNPLPVLSSANPSSANAGAGATTVMLTGSGFMTASTVSWNGTPLNVNL